MHNNRWSPLPLTFFDSCCILDRATVVVSQQKVEVTTENLSTDK